MVCLLAAPWVQLSVSAGTGWPHNALRHHWLMPISCHFRDCKALLVTIESTHVSGAIASVQTFTFIHHYKHTVFIIILSTYYINNTCWYCHTVVSDVRQREAGGRVDCVSFEVDPQTSTAGRDRYRTWWLAAGLVRRQWIRRRCSTYDNINVSVLIIPSPVRRGH